MDGLGSHWGSFERADLFWRWLEMVDFLSIL